MFDTKQQHLVQLIKPENSSVEQDMLAVALLLQSVYNQLDTEEEKDKYIRGIQNVLNSKVFKNHHDFGA